MSYNGLQPVQVNATPDTTGLNAGNLTSAFTASNLPNVNTYEVYHMTLTGAPIFAAAQIVIRNKTYSTVTADLNGNNEWDPQQAAIMNTGDELYFLWNIPASSLSKPSVTIWLRYDPTLTQNKYLGS